LGRNDSTLLGENRGKPAGGSPHQSTKTSAWGNNRSAEEITIPLGKINQENSLGIRLRQSSDTINSASGNICYSAGDDPYHISRNNSAGDADIDLLRTPVQSTGGMNSAGEMIASLGKT
jgi:hypothetical protein